jgi:hypothetical protein
MRGRSGEFISLIARATIFARSLGLFPDRMCPVIRAFEAHCQSTTLSRYSKAPD